MCMAKAHLDFKPTIDMAISGKHLQMQASMYQLHGANMSKLPNNISGGAPINGVGFPLRSYTNCSIQSTMLINSLFCMKRSFGIEHERPIFIIKLEI